MSSDEFKGEEKASFPGFLLFGVLLLVAVNVVAFLVDDEIGIPVLILTVIVVAAAVGYRLIAGSNRGAESDSTDRGLPKTGLDRDRPLGDTAEAHDEINPHDLPKDNPGRPAAEQMVQGEGGTTSGHDEGGAAGAGGSGDSDEVGADEAGRGARP